jgi:hypothetical protein
MFDVSTLATPAIYHHGAVFFTELAEQSTKTPHWFGGDLNLTVEGLAHGPHALHRIVTLDLTDKRLGISSAAGLRYLPLVYSMRLDSTEYDYLVESDRAICIKHSDNQTSLGEWPYEGFPAVLPRFGLRLLDPVCATLEEVQPLTHQGFTLAEPDQLVVIVPSIAEYGGVSLWGELGWGVQMIFYFTPSDRRVWATNQID